MIPTQDFLIAHFIFFNRIFFKSRIKLPRFEIINSSDIYGKCFVKGNYSIKGMFYHKFYPYDNGTIYISKFFHRKEKDILKTLIHEMIHLYILRVLQIYPIIHHDVIFYIILFRIKRTLKKWHNN